VQMDTPTATQPVNRDSSWNQQVRQIADANMNGANLAYPDRNSPPQIGSGRLPVRGEVDMNSVPTAAPGSNVQYHSANPMTRREQFNKQILIPTTASAQIGKDGITKLGTANGPVQTGGDNPANKFAIAARKKIDENNNGFIAGI